MAIPNAPDLFDDEAANYSSPALDAFAVVPSDAAKLAKVTRGIYVGGAGDVTVVMRGFLNEGGATVTFKSVPAGTVLPVRAAQVKATGTTATQLVGLYQPVANRLANPGFEANTSGWVAGASFAIVRDTSVKRSGSASLKATASASGGASTWRAAASLGLTLANGSPFQVGAWVYVPSGWSSGDVKVQWLDGAAGANDLNSAAADLGVRDAWQYVSVVANGNGGANQGIRVYANVVDTLKAGEFFYVDDALIDDYVAPPSQPQRPRLSLGGAALRLIL